MEDQDEKENKKKRHKQRVENQGELGLSTLEKESNISWDFSTFSSNIDISFHQLTEQYDTGSIKSLLYNTLSVSSVSTLDIEKTKEPKIERVEDSQEELPP